MTNRWPLVTLGTHIAHREEFEHIDDLREYKRCRVQLHARGIVLRDILPGALIKTKAQQVCHAGELLVAEIDAKVGGYGIVPESLDRAIVSNHYFLFTVCKETLDRRFLGYFLQTRGFTDQVTARGSTNYASVRVPQILEYTIPLPPLSEQRRIVAKLDAIAAKAEEAQKHQGAALRSADALFRSVLAVVFNCRLSPSSRLVPTFANVIAGQHVLASKTNLNGHGVPYMTGPADFGARIAVPTRWTTCPVPCSRSGDILVTVKGAGVGKINLAPDIETAIGRQLMAVRPRTEILDSFFAYYFLMAQLADLRELARSTTVPGISKYNVEHLIMPCLPLPEQHRIVAHLDGLQSKIDELKQHQTKATADLETLLPSVLDRAFRGEL